MDTMPQRRALREVGSYFHSRGWSLATSSNYSVILGHDPLQLLMTASGKDKGRLTKDDFLIVDGQGQPIPGETQKPSAETMLHVVIAQERPDVGSVLHTHSVPSTILSEKHFRERGIRMEGFEMLKGLAWVTTHQHREWVEIFDNTQDIPALAERVRQRLRDDNPLQHGFLIRRHGLYTWGRDLDEARRHIEVFEFLFEVMSKTA